MLLPLKLSGMPQRILVPVDSSAQSEQALEYAMETYPDAEITVLHVLEGSSGGLGTFSGMTGEPLDEEAERDHADEVFESARAVTADHAGEVETALGRGRPDRVIVKRAEDDDYDAIVIGSHGRDGLARVLLGSVAEKVVRRSPVPVVVVR